MPGFNPEPCYILAGPEAGRRDDFIREIRAACEERDGSPPETHICYAGEDTVQRMLGIARNGSLFSARRVVECRNAEAISGKDDVDALVSYLKAPCGETVLILATERYSLPKAIESAIPAACRKIFWELRDYEKPAWIRSRLAKDGLSADGDAVESILELVENETSSLEAACLRLASCFPPGARITDDDVEAALSRNRREDAFSLFDRIAAGDIEASLSVLDALLADRQSDSTQIIAALVWSFRALGRLARAMSEGMGADEAFRAQKITSKAGQKKFRMAMQRYGQKDCERIIRAASETEEALRGGLSSLFERQLLHLLVRSIVEEKGSGLILSGWKEQEYYHFT